MRYFPLMFIISLASLQAAALDVNLLYTCEAILAPGLESISYFKNGSTTIKVFGGAKGQIEQNATLIQQWTDLAIKPFKDLNFSNTLFVDLNGQSYVNENSLGATIRVRSNYPNTPQSELANLRARVRGEYSLSKTSPDLFGTYGQAIFTHEFAHDVFLLNIEDFCPPLAGIREIHLQYRRAWQMLEIARKELASIPVPFILLRTDPIAVRTVDLERRIRRLEALEEELLSQLRMKAKVSPYSELIADLHAVLATQELGAISTALAHLYGDLDSGRDFGRTYDLNSWADGSDHNLFAPVRSYLGRKIKELGFAHANKIYLAVLRASGSRISLEFSNRDEAELSIPERNRRMIEAIEKNLDEH